MRLSLNIKPSIITGNSKDKIKSRLRLYGWSCSNYGSYYSYSGGFKNDDYICVINFEKFRKKTKQNKKVVKGKSVTTSKVIRKAHWVGYYYLIPISFLKESRMKVIQKKNNFVFEKI